jgi:hypothetical protein
MGTRGAAAAAASAAAGLGAGLCWCALQPPPPLETLPETSEAVLESPLAPAAAAAVPAVPTPLALSLQRKERREVQRQGKATRMVARESTRLHNFLERGDKGERMRQATAAAASASASVAARELASLGPPAGATTPDGGVEVGARGVLSASLRERDPPLRDFSLALLPVVPSLLTARRQGRSCPCTSPRFGSHMELLWVTVHTSRE